MAKIENPYNSILDEINESLSLHKLESIKISRIVSETKLEESVAKYLNDPKVTEIRAKKKISEDDQGYLDINIFSSTYYKTKLNLSKEYNKEYRKYLDHVSDYKELIEKRVTKFELNASLISKFTPEELEKNPKLSKMMKEAPEGLDNSKKKYEKLDANLSRIYADFISKNSEDYAEKLYDFLYESKQFRKKFLEEKRTEIELEKEAEKTEEVEKIVNKNVFGKSQEEFNLLRDKLISEEKISKDQLNDLKILSSKLFTPTQIAALNKFEEELFEEFGNFNTTDRIIKQRLAITLNQFNIGVDEITDVIVETGSNDRAARILDMRFTEKIYSKDVQSVKDDPALLNLCVGYAACLCKHIENENKKQKKNIFGKVKVDIGLEKLILVHKNLCSYLIRVGINSDLLQNNILGTMITEAKIQELAFTLMNNVSTISNTVDIGDWQEGVYRILSRCIFAMVSSIETDKDPLLDVRRYEEEYLTIKTIEEKEKEERATRKINQVMKNGDMRAVIKAILQ